MNIRQRLCFVFICVFIWGGLIGCIAIAINSKTQFLVSRIDRNIAVEAHSSFMFLKMQEIQIAIRELEGASKTKQNKQKLGLANTEAIEIRIQQNLNLFEADLTSSLASTVAEIERYTKFSRLRMVKEQEAEKQFLLAIQQEFIFYKNKLNKLLVDRNISEAERAILADLEKQYNTKLFPLLVDYRKEREQQLAKHAQSLVSAIAAANRQIAASTIASIVAAIISVSLIYRSSLKSLERSQTVEQSERDDSVRQAEITLNKEKEIEAKLTKINRYLLNFCTDPSGNINQLTALLGELLGASCTLYSFLDNGGLRAVGQWQTPSEFDRVNRTKGRICHDLIQQNSDEIWVLSDLLTTKYAQSEPSIQAHNIKTYIGKVVKCQQQVVGCLSAWYTIKYMPSEIDRKIIDIIAAAIGIEEERRATQRSLQDEQRYALAAQAARDGLWDWNLNTDRIYLSKRSQMLMGFAVEDSETSAAEFFQRIHPADLNAVQMALGEHLAERTPQFESEYRITLADGSDRWLLCQGLALRDAEGKPYRIAGSQTDITERKQAEVQLRYQAYHDEQTGLPNRILLMERLRRAIDKQKHQEDYLFAVLFLDIDRFKVINDSLGHGFGDRMLKAIASRLQTCVRPGDTIARLGGDEFTLLLEAIGNEQEALQIAERIQQRLVLPFYLGEHEVFASASIGIALSTLNYEYPEDLLRDADTAMHRAKTLGKARTETFDPSMHNLAMARLQIEIDLRKALERQELRVFYQPIVSLKTGKTTGFEALVRWQHPTSGMIPPIKFIPVAEETGLICAIGWWVLQQACHQTRHWQERFPTEPPLTISVNVSGKQFTQSNLIEKIDQILQETGLAPTSLKLEITESVLVENAEAAAAVICQLRAMGIQFSIDDFGTGYSSLSYLHRLPIDTLKIDRSFVNNVDCEPEKIEIIRTIVALAWNLGMNVVAEGVETKTQMYQLQALKSEYGQGYFFSKPTDSEAVEA
ncbi:putative bifunctional diguanylate cyclase/phosphodiesterase, partial [Chroococcidiopsis sp.]|uniref:sensor domain-containing phosphodiesterase n=1 Tax=Chroococcidiopsis sp. TaxID=3088168 RepID=UPI003F3F2761